MTILKKSKGPRVYVTLKDALTKETKGYTIEGANLKQVMDGLEKAFANPSHHAAPPRRSRRAASPEPLPHVARAKAGVLNSPDRPAPVRD